jgi:hypothetical protein
MTWKQFGIMILFIFVLGIIHNIYDFLIGYTDPKTWTSSLHDLGCSVVGMLIGFYIMLCGFEKVEEGARTNVEAGRGTSEE